MNFLTGFRAQNRSRSARTLALFFCLIMGLIVTSGALISAENDAPKLARQPLAEPRVPLAPETVDVYDPSAMVVQAVEDGVKQPARPVALDEFTLARQAYARMVSGDVLLDGDKLLIERYRSLLPALRAEEQDYNVRSSLDNNGGTFYTFTGNIPVPSSGTGGGTIGPEDSTYSTIAVSGFVGNIGDVEVTIDSLYHSYDGDLRITLVSPTGTQRGMIYSRGGSGDNFMGTLLDDEAPVAISTGSAPFNALNGYRPEQTLSTFDGENPNGTWTLIIYDNSGGDSGFLKGWKLQIVAPPAAPDLLVENLAPCGIVAPNPSQTVSVRVRNAGGSASAATTVDYVFDGGLPVIEAVPALPPSSFFDVFFAVPVNLTGGPHTLSSTVATVVGETNLADNSTNCAITAQRPCADCTPVDVVLDPVPPAYGTTVSGDCGNGGKWVGSFTTIAGRAYHFDVCNQLPGGGDASFDIDLKITDNLCNILAYDDGPSGCSYHSQDYVWIAPSSGTYYLIFAPYPASGHSCSGTTGATFTLDYYEVVPPPPPSNDDCANAITVAVPSSTTGQTLSASPEIPAPTVCGTTYTGANGVWYKVIGDDHQFTATLCNATTDYDTKIFVFTGTCGALVCAAGNDDDATCTTGPGTPNFKSTLTWCSISGIEYYILVTGFSLNSGNFALDISQGACCNPRVHNLTQLIDYCAITAALFAANPADVIQVDAGSFVENLYIDRPVTLNGPNAFVDPRTDCGGTTRNPEAVIDGSGISATVQIAADGVVLNGFTIIGGENGLNSGVYVDAARQGYVVEYNIITDNAIGMYANSAGAATISHNLIAANNRPGPAGGSGVYSEYTNSLTISHNEFSGHVNNNPVIFAATAPSVHVGLAFNYNNVHDDYGLFALAMSGAQFLGNRMTATASATACTFGGGCIGVDFNNNVVSNSLRGLRIADFGYGMGDNGDIEAHGNHFDSPSLSQFAVGVLSGYTTVFDASNNWWGSNSAAAIPGFIDNSGAPVDYTPWLDTGVEPVSDVCDGFQGDFTALHVDDDSPQSGVVHRVEEGVNSVSGSTVYVSPGTYIGSVLISGIWPSGLNILGPNAGVNPCMGARTAEAILDGGGAEAIDVRSDNVTLDGLKVINSLNGIVVNQVSSGVTVRNNIVDGCTDTGVNLWRAATAVVQFNQITNCAIAGVSGGDDAGTPVPADDVPTSAIIADNCLNNNRLAITGYHISSNILRNSIENFAAAPPAAGISGQMLNSLVRGNTVSGYSASAGIALTSYPNRPNSVNVVVDSNVFAGNGAGLYMNDPLTGLSVTRNYFSNSVLNAHDVNSSYYDANCWSDFSSNPGFPAQYDVGGGGGNTDYNPNPNGCSNVSFMVTSGFVGCNPACQGDTLYLTFDQVGFIAGQIFVQLPAEIDADWAPGTQYQNIFPGTNTATNLVFAAGRRAAGNQIEVNVQWQPPYSDGDGLKYIACIPIRNVTGVDDQVLCISGGASTFYDPSGPQVNVFTMGTACVTVDCEAPVVTFTENSAPVCNALNNSAPIAGAYTISIPQGSLPNSQLALAYVEVNANALQRITLFNTLQVGDYTNTTFATALEAAMIFGWLAEGCNTLVLHAFDAECNEGVSAGITIVKDTTPPNAIATNLDPPFCYNNNPSGSTYGGNLLDDKIDISTTLDPTLLGTCAATTGTVEISYLSGTPLVLNLPPDLAGYPATDAEALALWNWILPQVVGANGESYTFDVRVCDCAGNCTLTSFTICIDITAPANTVTVFDARPTDLGVWLKWQWTYDGSQAVEMQVWRSPYDAQYPLYSIQYWNQPANAAAYAQTYPPAGWTLVASQLGISGVNSTVYTAANGKGNVNHSGPGAAYWEDEDASWLDNSEDRNIYRYVTFVRDFGGNWSQLAAYTPGTNADRSTNYWLGDYTRDLLVSPDASDGIVDGPDLGFLSGVYFTSVVPATRIFDIGFENSENGIGKGIPVPDGLINFSDLVPFSFNYGIVTPSSFNVRRPNTPEFAPQLDDRPVVILERADNNVIAVDGTFRLVAKLTGNSANSAKVVEAIIGFDRNILEVVSITNGAFEVVDGVPFASVRELEGTNGRIGVAGAALGEAATLSGDVTLAVIEFRWTNDRQAVTELAVIDGQMSDGFGNILTGGGNTMGINAVGAIPRSFALYQNYPNPFNPETQIAFDLPENMNVSLVIFNLMGQRVRTLVSGAMSAGQHRVQWDGKDESGEVVGTGLYVYTIQAGANSATKKMMFLR